MSRDGGSFFPSTVAQTVGSGQTIVFDLLYTYATSWMLVDGGDVIACQDLSSVVPPSAVPAPYFILASDGGYPGVALYGTWYSFDESRLYRTGRESISQTGWIAQSSNHPLCNTQKVNFYKEFAHAVDVKAMTPKRNLLGERTKDDFPDAATYVIGDLTLGGSDDTAWALSQNEKKTIVVDGNVTIRRNITYPNGGFFGLIVNGDITINSTVGSNPSTRTPSLRGFYATSPQGRLNTGRSTITGKEKLVILGTVAVGGVNLQRNLDTIGMNHTTPGEEFIYDTHLIMNLPEAFLETNIVWQEVPP